MIKQLRGLSYPDKWLLFKALVLALFIRIALKIIQFKHLIALLKFLNKKDNFIKTTTSVERLEYLLILTNRIRPYLLINCLSISTTFWLLLKNRGIKSDLKFGMEIEKNKLNAHAWLEIDGQPMKADADVKKKYISFKETIL